MAGVRSTWAAMPRRSRFVAAVVPLVVVVAATGTVLAVGLGTAPAPRDPPPPPPPPVAAASTPPPLPPEPSLEPSASPDPTPTPAPAGADPLLGTDGRLTVLLLGSDYRPPHPGNRTDAHMVGSVDPVSGKAAGFSIPRDTVNFPMAGGGVYQPKVNGLYAYLQSRGNNGGVAMSRAVAAAFKVEIDGYAFLGFAGAKGLVAGVGGVDVTLDKPYYD